MFEWSHPDDRLFQSTPEMKPSAGVFAWLNAVEDDALLFRVVRISEIRKGIDRLPEGKRRTFLKDWLSKDLPHWFAGRIVPVTDDVLDQMKSEGNGSTLRTAIQPDFGTDATHRHLEFRRRSPPR